MRDRVLALGGLFRLRQEPRGTRLRVLLRQPLGNGVGETPGGLG
jgi:signal transduction histidine kinase